ncbi:hypothetical protein Tco_0517543 [Tanacetum coccineum]
MSEVDAPNEAQKPVSSNHGGNGPFVTVAERVKIKGNKVLNYVCREIEYKHKYLCAWGNDAANEDKAKGKHIEIGSTSRIADKKRKISAFDPTLKESTELEWSPRAPRSSKGKAIANMQTNLCSCWCTRSKDKSVAKKIKNITLTTISECTNDPASSERTKTRNREHEPQATVEARVAPEQSNVTKKHPRHRTGCKCIICIQPQSRSKHSPTCSCRACVAKRLRVKNMAEKACQKPRIWRQTKVPEPAEPSNQQIIRVSHGSEENQVERREPSPSAEPSNQQTIIVQAERCMFDSAGTTTIISGGTSLECLNLSSPT